MKPSIIALDTDTGEKMYGITMIDAEAWEIIRQRKEQAELRSIRRMDHGPLGKFYLATCRTDNLRV